MLRHAVAILSALLLSVSLHAADADKASYTATVDGVSCSACREHVETALKKLPGVLAVSFAKGDTENSAKATFASSSGSLAKEDVIKALGKDAETYTVVNLEKSK